MEVKILRCQEKMQRITKNAEYTWKRPSSPLHKRNLSRRARLHAFCVHLLVQGQTVSFTSYLVLWPTTYPWTSWNEKIHSPVPAAMQLWPLSGSENRTWKRDLEMSQCRCAFITLTVNNANWKKNKLSDTANSIKENNALGRTGMKTTVRVSCLLSWVSLGITTKR